MRNQTGFTGHLFLFFQIAYLFSPNVAVAGGGGGGDGRSPFTPRASLIRYWKSQIRSGGSEPPFLLSKASPMSAVESATFARLAGQNALAPNLASFCSSARLLCFPDLAPSLEKHDSPASFSVYTNRNFTNYGTSRTAGIDTFKNYSNGENLPADSFRRYGRGSTKQKESFDAYGEDGNVVDQGFHTYGTGGTGGSDEFLNYNRRVNVPDLKFQTYSSNGNDHQSTFTGYTEDTNSGKEAFASYSREGNTNPLSFATYARSSNVIDSKFTGYGESGNFGNDSFVSYGSEANVPENTFNSYEEGASQGTLSFQSYRDQSNVGDDSFQSYAKKSTSQAVRFGNYGKSFNQGSESFNGYGQGARHPEVGFDGYSSENTTFTGYADKKVASFKGYTKRGSSAATTATSSGMKAVNRWVEPGKFFRESMLKAEIVLPMPDIRDKMPRRWFLPRPISSKLPFSTSKLPELKRIFHAADNSSTAAMMVEALGECERAPSRGETKRCVGSAEDMVDFATSVLGRNVVVRTTEGVAGSGRAVMVGSVRRIHGGAVTKSVSCHQSLYPYLLYYCHSVPMVRVYEADLLDPKTRSKINHGVAVCHVDTSAWSPTHGAFLALGSGPGRIEVCHWIFENDVAWTRAD